MQFSIMFARFPYHGIEHPDTVDWMVETVLKCKADPRISDVFKRKYDDTPITMTRNKAVKEALKRGVDYLLFIDNDMAPDLPGEKPFWDSSWEFLMKHRDRPSVIAAPYCGPPPINNVYMFRWATWMNDSPNVDMRLEQFTREEAAQRGGIEQVAAMPTGLMIIDMRIFAKLKAPWFYYEWVDAEQSEKASTEDVTFTRDVTMRGIPCWCNWNSWAGHHKPYRVDKPKLISIDQVNEKYIEAVRNNMHMDERMTMIGEGEETNGEVRRVPMNVGK